MTVHVVANRNIAYLQKQKKTRMLAVGSKTCLLCLHAKSPYPVVFNPAESTSHDSLLYAIQIFTEAHDSFRLAFTLRVNTRTGNVTRALEQAQQYCMHTMPCVYMYMYKLICLKLHVYPHDATTLTV